MYYEANFTDALNDQLRRKGIVLQSVLGTRHMHEATAFEPPLSCSAELFFDYPLSIGAFTHVNGGFIRNVSIGRYCSIARDVQIGHGFHPTNWLSVSSLQYVQNYRDWPSFIDPEKGGEAINLQHFEYSKPTQIGNDVWLGNHAIIMDGLTIGDGAIVGGGSVVTRDVPPYAIVVGNPARILRMRFDERTIDRLLTVRFWRFTMNDLGGVHFHDIQKALNQIEEKLDAGILSEYKPDAITTDWIRRESTVAT